VHPVLGFLDTNQPAPGWIVQCGQQRQHPQRPVRGYACADPTLVAGAKVDLPLPTGLVLFHLNAHYAPDDVREVDRDLIKHTAGVVGSNPLNSPKHRCQIPPASG